MKIRIPPTEAPELRVAREARWRAYEGELITPLIGGGVDAGEVDKELPVRAASIRGHLRFWWRFLNADQFNGSRALFQAERDLWGGMAQGDEGYPSQVRLRVRLKGRPEIETVKINNNNSYVLFPFQEAGSVCWVKQGLRFVLDVQCDDEHWPQVEAALRWWATFDGVGMRTRRGMGKMKMSGLEPVTAGEAQEHGCRLVVRQKATPGNAWSAARKAVSMLKHYRQGEDEGRNPGNGKRPGRSRWPEADAIRAITGQHANNHPVEHPLVNPEDERPFPRAFFGMPIIYEIRGEGEPPKHSLQPWGYERMASPLFLFPYPVTGGYKPAALRLPVTHLENMDLNLKQIGGQPRDRQQNAGAWWPQDAQAAADWAGQIRPMQGRGSNPLDAFLNFFGDQR